MTTALKTHRPTGRAPWPLILLTGEPGSGKSWTAAEFSGCERVGQAFWLDLGEGCAEEYGQVPGADYEVIEHDGTWVQIIEQARAVKEVAQQAQEAGEPPVVFVIDSMTSEWAMLSEWTDKRARRQKGNRAKLADDPDAEVDITTNLWNDANSRHNRLMNILKTFPGIAVMICSEKEVTQMDKGGNPTSTKEWKPEGHKFLARDCSVWVRFLREDHPVVVKCRSVHYGIRPGVDKPKKVPNLTFDWLVFDLLKCDPATTRARDMRTLNADQQLPEEATEADGKQQQNGSEALAQAARYILGAKNATDAGSRGEWLDKQGDLGDSEVMHLLTDVDREVLGLVGIQSGTLAAVAKTVSSYCQRHGDDHQCDGMEHVSAHGPRTSPENPGTPIQASNGVAAVAS